MLILSKIQSVFKLPHCLSSWFVQIGPQISSIYCNWLRRRLNFFSSIGSQLCNQCLHAGPPHAWGLMLCSRCLESLNNCTFEFVFCMCTCLGLGASAAMWAHFLGPPHFLGSGPRVRGSTVHWCQLPPLPALSPELAAPPCLPPTAWSPHPESRYITHPRALLAHCRLGQEDSGGRWLAPLRCPYLQMKG